FLDQLLSLTTSENHLFFTARAVTMVYSAPIAQPPSSVTIVKWGEANLVRHIPAKSSHGAAKSSVMRPSAQARWRDKPTTTSDRAAAITPYIGTCTWVS